MGYRSDVGIALVFDSAESCDTFIMAYKVKEPEVWRRDIEGHWHRADPEVLTGVYEDVKWDRMYEDVDSVYQMLEFAKKNFNAAWRLVRTGEDAEDIADECDCSDDREKFSGFDLMGKAYNYVNVRRRIDIDVSGEPI